MLQDLFAWLTALPPPALYSALAVIAAVENVFPPFPADTIVAFGAFLAARGEASLLGAFLGTWLGNVAGAMLMYWAGREIGADRVQQRFPALHGSGGAADRIARLYGSYGVPALVVSRFLPGIRALVPPTAGALGVRPLTAALAISIASGAWYGAIAVLAFNVGARWEDLQARIGSLGRTAGIVAVAIVVVVAAVVLLRRRRRARR